MILDSTELPGTNWKFSLQQAMRLNAFNKNDPINIRAKHLHSTSVRRLFKGSINSESIIVEVTPLNSKDDAALRVDNFDERMSQRLSQLVRLQEHSALSDLNSHYLDSVKGFEYSFDTQAGHRTTRSIAANVGSVFIFVRYGSDGPQWPWNDLLQLAERQGEKVRKVLDAPRM